MYDPLHKSYEARLAALEASTDEMLACLDAEQELTDADLEVIFAD